MFSFLWCSCFFHTFSATDHGLDSSLTKNSQIETSKASSSFLQKPYGAEILKQKCRTHTDSKSLVKLKETIKKQKENRYRYARNTFINNV